MKEKSKIDIKIIQIIERLINIANCYMDYYCEYKDEYVLNEDEIGKIDDIEEKEEAKKLKNDDIFLKEASDFINKLKQVQ